MLNNFLVLRTVVKMDGGSAMEKADKKINIWLRFEKIVNYYKKQINIWCMDWI